MKPLSWPECDRDYSSNQPTGGVKEGGGGGFNFSSVFSTFWSRICSAASLNCTECPLTQST